MFGDGNWLSQRSAEQESRFYKWVESVKQDGQKLAIIEIGAGTAIPTVRWRGEEIVSDHADAKLIRINPREFAIDDRYGFGLPNGGLEGLKQVLE